MKNMSSCIAKIYKNVKYKGDYLNGKREGKGIYKYNNEDIYEGEYKNHLKDGEGVYKFENEDIYTGQYQKGCFNWKGKYDYSDGASTNLSTKTKNYNDEESLYIVYCIKSSKVEDFMRKTKISKNKDEDLIQWRYSLLIKAIREGKPLILIGIHELQWSVF